MSLVFRSDFAETLGPPVRTKEGFLRVDAYLTAAGVFPYQDAKGGTRYEYRPPDEVFSEAAIASWRDKPVTDDHPPEMVNPDNAHLYRKGHIIGDSLRREGNRLRGTLQIEDRSLISKMESGKTELSGGYWCHIADRAGTCPDGRRYDAVQGGYHGNHEAVVHEARIPGSAARVFDGAAFMRADSSAPEKTMKLAIHGLTFDVAEDIAKAIDAERADAAKALDLANAKADAATDKATKAEKERTDALEAAKLVPAQFDAAVKARVALVVVAEQHEVKHDGLSDRAVKVAVVEKLSGRKVTDKHSDDYVTALYDAACEDAAKASASLGAARAAVTGAVMTDAAPSLTAAQAHAEMVARNRNDWKPKEN